MKCSLPGLNSFYQSSRYMARPSRVQPLGACCPLRSARFRVQPLGPGLADSTARRSPQSSSSTLHPAMSSYPTNKTSARGCPSIISTRVYFQGENEHEWKLLKDNLD